MNSMSIHQLGRLLDALTMPRNVYMSFLAGVLGGAATVELWAALQGAPQPLTVGASAGACGLLGALLALTYKARGGFFGELRKELLSSTILLILIGFLPGISGAGHFGGLLAGGACGWVIRNT
jgi:membrane associated rhomboid family serine protease